MYKAFINPCNIMLYHNKDWMSTTTYDRKGVSRDDNNHAIAELSLAAVGGKSKCEKETCPLTQFNTLEVRAENRVMRESLSDRTNSQPTSVSISSSMFSAGGKGITNVAVMFEPINGAVSAPKQTATKKPKVVKVRQGKPEPIASDATRTRVASGAARTRVASDAARTRAKQYARRQRLLKQ